MHGRGQLPMHGRGQLPMCDPSLQCVASRCFHAYFDITLVFIVSTTMHFFPKIHIIFIQIEKNTKPILFIF